MAKEKIMRPDSGTVKRMIEEATRLDTGLLAVQNSEGSHRRAAQQAAQKLYDDRIQKALEAMDVEHVNRGKQGLRVGFLRDNGIENVWQLSKVNFQQLCDIDGLGEQSARKIQDTVKAILRNTKETIRIRIQVDSPDPVDDDLIRALYIRIHGKRLREQAKVLYRENHKPLQQELVLVRKSLSGLGWLFKSQGTKQQIQDAVLSLEARLNGSFGRGLADWEQMENAPAETCWSDYQRNASVYYAELENLGLNWEKQDTAGGLPVQLAAEIEAHPLDLRYLKATLRSYQTFGAKYIVHQKKTLLGDEMGLGKTVQAIASMAALAATGKSHFIVVCPASVLINWCREIRKFSDLEVTKVHGNDEAALLYWRENGGVMVTTFESISRFGLPEKFRISMVITDEAHYVKNPDTLRTKALLKLLEKNGVRPVYDRHAVGKQG